MKKIHYPTAESLDTGNWDESSGYRIALYLVPAAETTDGIPQVKIHAGIGTIGCPMPAYHHRWAFLGDYGPQVIGESVLEQLQASERHLLALSNAYIGNHWDGNNFIGKWRGRVDEYDDIVIEPSCYWSADDWFGPAGIRWPELCAEAGIDPERALTEDLETLGAIIAAEIEADQEELVSGTVEYAVAMAEDWINSRRDEELE